MYLLLSNIDDYVNIHHFTPTPDSLQRMKNYDYTQNTDADLLANSWLDQLTIDKKYEEHLPVFLSLLERFADI